jgi:hypothetical protein
LLVPWELVSRSETRVFTLVISFSTVITLRFTLFDIVWTEGLCEYAKMSKKEKNKDKKNELSTSQILGETYCLERIHNSQRY